jgi:DNA-binding transcriptional LysR family regulator
MLQPSQLHTLRTVLISGSFAGAAEVLNYTPSAVSQQMAALERTSGLSLFERSAHSVKATAHAHLLADRAAEMLAVLDGLEHDVAALARGDTGVLRIGSFPTASARLLPAALASLTKARPGADISVEEGELGTLLPGLVSGELDLALAYRYDTAPASWPAQLTETPLLREKLWLLLPATHSNAQAETVRLTKLRHERWIAPLAESPGALNLERATAQAGFAPKISFRSNDYSVVRELVAAGLGVALVPDLALAETANVAVKSLTGGQIHRHVLALHRPSNHNALIETALSVITATARALV